MIYIFLPKKDNIIGFKIDSVENVQLCGLYDIVFDWKVIIFESQHMLSFLCYNLFLFRVIYIMLSFYVIIFYHFPLFSENLTHSVLHQISELPYFLRLVRNQPFNTLNKQFCDSP